MPGSSNPNLSGAAWWHANQAKYPNSHRLEDLETHFRAKVEKFLAALKAAGAHVTVGSTRRNASRAYLMHWAWQVAHGLTQPSKVPPPPPGLAIVWDHGDVARSRKAAQEMVHLFGMAHNAALHSNHIAGKAIDMTISWSGVLKIRNQAGKEVVIAHPPHNGQNTQLHQVGATYEVFKLSTDPPHWSWNGH